MLYVISICYKWIDLKDTHTQGRSQHIGFGTVKLKK
jgi:hypothetical protein